MTKKKKFTSFFLLIFIYFLIYFQLNFISFTSRLLVFTHKYLKQKEKYFFIFAITMLNVYTLIKIKRVKKYMYLIYKSRYLQCKGL